MQVEEYLNLSSEHSKYRNYLSNVSIRKTVIKTGMLLFNSETACCWGGPFPGNYAFFRLTDERSNKLLQQETNIIQRLEKDILNDKYRRIKKVEETNKLFQALKIQYLNEYPTIEKPYCLYMMGNDDTSYSMNFETEKEALEYIELLELCQPLDIEDIYCSFAFTN
jgi:hypothetical protein